MSPGLWPYLWCEYNNEVVHIDTLLGLVHWQYTICFLQEPSKPLPVRWYGGSSYLTQDICWSDYIYSDYILMWGLSIFVHIQWLVCRVLYSDRCATVPDSNFACHRFLPGFLTLVASCWLHRGPGLISSVLYSKLWGGWPKQNNNIGVDWFSGQSLWWYWCTISGCPLDLQKTDQNRNDPFCWRGRLPACAGLLFL